jgi:hypothetical protein
MQSLVATESCQAIRTDKGNYLVKMDGVCYYADEQGNFIRTAKDADEEWNWALSKWSNPEILDISKLPDGFLENLKNCLKYLI